MVSAHKDFESSRSYTVTPTTVSALCKVLRRNGYGRLLDDRYLVMGKGETTVIIGCCRTPEVLGEVAQSLQSSGYSVTRDYYQSITVHGKLR